MSTEKQESKCIGRATHVSRLDAKDFHEDNWANNFTCGEENENFGIEFYCEPCLRRMGIIW